MSKYLKLKYLLTWILFLIMYFLTKLPFNLQIAIGKQFGNLLKIIFKSRAKIALINIKKCFPEKKENEISNLLGAHFKALGIGVIEMANCFYASNKKIKKLYTLKGRDNLEKALNSKKPVLLVLGHFTPMLIAGRMLNQNYKIADVYFKAKNELFQKVMVSRFIAYGARMVDNQDMRDMIRAMKENYPLWYTPDQDYGANPSVFAPFFNIQTATTTATARLAKITDAIVIPFSYYRDNKNHYQLTLHKPLKDYPIDDDEKNASITNKILETDILKVPEQYLWIHKRFKTRPNNEPSFYE